MQLHIFNVYTLARWLWWTNLGFLLSDYNISLFQSTFSAEIKTLSVLITYEILYWPVIFFLISKKHFFPTFLLTSQWELGLNTHHYCGTKTTPIAQTPHFLFASNEKINWKLIKAVTVAIEKKRVKPAHESVKTPLYLEGCVKELAPPSGS